MCMLLLCFEVQECNGGILSLEPRKIPVSSEVLCKRLNEFLKESSYAELRRKAEHRKGGEYGSQEPA